MKCIKNILSTANEIISFGDIVVVVRNVVYSCFMCAALCHHSFSTFWVYCAFGLNGEIEILKTFCGWMRKLMLVSAVCGLDGCRFSPICMWRQIRNWSPPLWRRQELKSNSIKRKIINNLVMFEWMTLIAIFSSFLFQVSYGQNIEIASGRKFREIHFENGFGPTVASIWLDQSTHIERSGGHKKRLRVFQIIFNDFSSVSFCFVLVLVAYKNWFSPIFVPTRFPLFIFLTASSLCLSHSASIDWIDSVAERKGNRRTGSEELLILLWANSIDNEHLSFTTMMASHKHRFIVL